MSNKTREDAYSRLSQAMLGSFDGATDNYLLSLRQYLYGWIANIDMEMHKRIEKERI